MGYFSEGDNPWFWSKNRHFSNFFCWGNIGHENVFYDILEEKNASLVHKIRSSKSRKIDIFPKGLTHAFAPKMTIFPKGLTHGFGQKWPFFQLYFLGNIGKENVFYDVLERKNIFLGYK